MSDESIKNNSEQNTPKSAENTENEDFVDINSSSEDEVVFHGTIRETQNNSDTLPEEQDTVPQKIKASKKRIVTNTVCIVLACIMIIAGSGFIVVFSIFSRVGYAPINNTEDEIKSSSQVSKQNSQINNHTYEGKLLNDQQILNILLIGADTRYNATSGNSDTMILLSIDTKNKKIKLLSLLRDTYIAIPGYEGNKLNAPFAFNGAELTVKTIQLNYGIQIDRYAIVDFYSFKEIIDSIGGLDIDLTEEEIDYINWQIWINEQPEYSELPAGEYKDSVRAQLLQSWLVSVPESSKPINKDILNFKENGDDEPTARVKLNGRQALWQARNRGEEGLCSGDDYTRTLRQRNVISLMITKLKNSDISTVMSIIYEIGPMITTNLKTSEITSLAANITKYLKYDIVSQSAPDRASLGIDYYFEDIYNDNGYIGNCIVIIDWDDFRDKVAGFVLGTENKLKIGDD